MPADHVGNLARELTKLEGRARKQEQLCEMDPRGSETSFRRLADAIHLLPGGISELAVDECSRELSLELAARGGLKGSRDKEQGLRSRAPCPELLRALIQSLDFLDGATVYKGGQVRN